MKRRAWLAAIALLAYFGVRNWERSATMERPKEPPAPRALHSQHDQRGTGLPQRAPSAAPATDDCEGGIVPRPRPVISGPMVEQRIDYYEVSGTSARELWLSMDRLGPKGASQQPRSSVAATSWDVRWQADYWSGEGSCAIKSFTTHVKIRVVMPKWTGRVAGHPLTERWDSFTQAVSVHEQGHAEHGILAAKAIQQRVSTLAPAGTCRELDDSITSTARTFIDRYRKEDIEYDWRRTRDAVFDDDETLWLYGLVPRPITPPAVVDAEMTDTDRQRQAGTLQFETDMDGLSARVDEADAAWRIYTDRCRRELVDRGATAAVGPRAWFAYAWAGEIAARGAPQCAEARAFYALVDPIKDRMCAAEERARRSLVYPGTRRELRSRYRLEWQGWDRVCGPP